MRYESGKFEVGRQVIVSIHGQRYVRTVQEIDGNPYIEIQGEKAFENDLSNYRPKHGKFDKERYAREYRRTHYDRMTILARKGTKETWKQFAADRGMSLSAFVTYCVEKELYGYWKDSK